MIKNLHIQNFKSIKDLKLDCTRVNVFIGEPNTGKSNILESVGILSYGYANTWDADKLKDFVRYELFSDIFYNNEIGNKISILFQIDKDSVSEVDISENNILYTHKLEIEYTEKNDFRIVSEGVFKNCNFEIYYESAKAKFEIKDENYNSGTSPFVRFFRFKELKNERPDNIYVLKPPDGRNLVNVLNTNKNILEFLAEIVSPFGFKLKLNSQLRKIELIREKNNIQYVYPLSLLSDTFLNIIRYYAAIETSKKHTLVFEEPETHIFPFYNKFLAEKIALYNTNQFFIATHNPTFLINLIEQTPDKELSVFITYYDKESYETKVVSLKGKDADKLLEYGNSLFINLDRFYE
jgi:AAA15 family ATPase/GTPase